MRGRPLPILFTALALAGLAGIAVAEEPPASWFTVSPVAEGTWRIDDHGGDNLYLVAGKQKALLIDTGLGVGDIMKVVRTLTPLPVVVVDTHGHPDHVGGNNQFAEVYAHPDDFDLVRLFDSKQQRAGTREKVLKIAQIPADQLFPEPATPRPARLLPATNGFVFDLGGRRLEVIATPGHTKGEICLLDKDQRLLFTGDDNNTLQWQFLEQSTSLAAYLRTLEALDTRKDFDTILPGHGPALEKSFIAEQIACARSILDGSCKDEPYESFAGKARLCRHGRAAIAFDPKKLR